MSTAIPPGGFGGFQAPPPRPMPQVDYLSVRTQILNKGSMLDEVSLKGEAAQVENLFRNLNPDVNPESPYLGELKRILNRARDVNS